MKFDPVPFNAPDGRLIGKFTAQLSPDGWVEPMYENTKGCFLKSEEVAECSKFINSFLKELSTQDIFVKYVKKWGEKIDNVTAAVSYVGNLLEYVATMSGYSVTITVHRKGK